MRKGMPVEVYFVDAAWAPHSAEGHPDTPRSSVLVAMRGVLAGCLAARDAAQRAVYQALYGTFADAFREIDGLVFPNGQADEKRDDFSPSPAGLEDAMDGWEPEEDEEGGVAMEDDWDEGSAMDIGVDEEEDL
jgi:hypothetical protein